MHEITLTGYTAACATASGHCLSFGTRGSYGIEKLRVIPGDGWEDMLISVTFHPPGMEPVKIILDETGVIDVPQEATAVAATEYAPGKIVFCGCRDGATVISADRRYLVDDHAETDGAESNPTPSQWAQLVEAYQSKLDKQQGSENAGKVLGIGEDGLVKPVEQTGGGGNNGATFTPNVSEDGVISWTNDGGLPNPEPVNIKGAPGNPGKPGDDYVLTEADKQEIAEQAAQLVEVPEVEIPDKLPNPNALTFTGAVSGTYDGSSPLTVEIPTGGSSGSSGIVFNDSYVSDANLWTTNGYTKTGNQKTINLPSEFDNESKWGVLFFIAENATNKTGTQMLYPIAGNYKGTIWTRGGTNGNFGEWKQLLTADAISNGVKNPNAITFTGSSVGTYDGSEPLTVEIPEGGSGGGSAKEWRLFKTITVPATAAEGADGVAWFDCENGGVLFAFDTDDDGNPFDFDDLFVEMNVGGITGGTTAVCIAMGNTPGYDTFGHQITQDSFPAEKLQKYAALVLKVSGNKWIALMTKHPGGAVANAYMHNAAFIPERGNNVTENMSWKSIRVTLPYKYIYGYYQGSTFTFYGR